MYSPVDGAGNGTARYLAIPHSCDTGVWLISKLQENIQLALVESKDHSLI